MKRPIKIVGSELVRDPTWTDAEYEEHLRRHRASQRLGSVHLLALAAAHVIRTICALPDQTEADDAHVRHVITIADAVEQLAERHGHWTTEAAQALVDLKSARVRAAWTIEGGR